MTKKLELQGTRMFPGALSDETSFRRHGNIHPSHLIPRGLPMPASMAKPKICVGKVASQQQCRFTVHLAIRQCDVLKT